MVNAVRSQSHEAPSFLSCFKIMPPCSCVHSHACSRNSSRVKSLFLIPFSESFFTTFASVAIEAWSVPGTQHAFLPSMRARRTRISWIVLLSIQLRVDAHLRLMLVGAVQVQFDDAGGHGIAFFLFNGGGQPALFSAVRTRISVGSGSRLSDSRPRMTSAPGKNCSSRPPVQWMPS